MKKTWVAFGIAFFLLALTVSPARAMKSPIKGLKAGFTLANMTGDDIEENKAKIGYVIGAYLTISVSDGFSIQPELLIVQKGTKWTEGSDEFVIRLTYLEVPILAKYGFDVGADVGVSVFAGPLLAFNIGATEEWDWDGESGSDDFDGEKKIDFGLTFGAGLEKPFGQYLVSFDVRYTLGLSNCCEDEFREDYKIKNNAVVFLAGIGF